MTYTCGSRPQGKNGESWADEDVDAEIQRRLESQDPNYNRDSHLNDISNNLQPFPSQAERIYRELD